MRAIAFVLLGILCVVLAKGDSPKYSCPEYDVDFRGNDITCGDCGVPGVQTWENCGMMLKTF